MTADIIQAQYERLDTIAGRFGQEAEKNAALAQQVALAVQTLQNGGWEGKGAAAFFAEMEATTNPALQRLIHALEEARTATLNIKQIIQTAEQEASAPFNAAGSNGTGSSTGPSGTTSPQPGVFPPGFTPIPGQPGAPPSVAPIPKPATTGSSFWDRFRAKDDFWAFDSAKGADGSRKGGKFSPGIKATFGTEESSVWGNPKGDGVAVVGGYGEVGLKANLDDGVMIGGGGEFYTVKGEWDTALVGDKEYGVTGSVGFKGPSAGGFAGFQFDRKDQAIGASIGVNAVSVDGSVGGNVAGVNVSLTGEVGLKAELGLKIGRRTEVKLPFISFGLKFGGGVD